MPDREHTGRQKMRRFSQKQRGGSSKHGQAHERERVAGGEATTAAAPAIAGSSAGYSVGGGRGEVDAARTPLGIGLGGVHQVGGGSLGDRDLSGRDGSELGGLEDIVGDDDTTVGPGSDVGATGAVSVSGRDRTTSTGFGYGGDVDIADLGSDRGIIDTTRDPIGGTGDEDNGLGASDDMVEGEVGAQAEGDLTELLGEHNHARFDADDARLQQGLTELIEEDDDEEEDRLERR
jgi:hypothetical protein